MGLAMLMFAGSFSYGGGVASTGTYDVQVLH